MLILASTLDLLGKVLISYTALSVHHRVRKEHKIDDKVFYAMRRESLLGVIGIILMVVSYVIEAVHIFWLNY